MQEIEDLILYQNIKKVDHICLAEHELNLEIRSKGNLEDNIIALTKKVTCKRITITSGERGMIHYFNGKFLEYLLLQQMLLTGLELVTLFYQLFLLLYVKKIQKMWRYYLVGW